MRQPTLLIPLLFALLQCTGCAPFWIEMTLEPRDSERQMAVPSEEELAIVLTTVSETASEFGLRKSRNLDGPGGLIESTGAGDHWSHQILTLYQRADEKTAYSRVEIEVRRDKNTNEISVLIVDRDGDSYEVFTKDLEAALSSALTSALPSRRVEVARQ